MVYCLQDIQEQWSHTPYESNQPISDLTKGSLHEMEPCLSLLGDEPESNSQGLKVNPNITVPRKCNNDF